MSTYPNLSKEPELLDLKTRNDEIKNLKYRSEKHNHQKNLKCPKTDNEYYKKEYKSLNKKKVLLIITESLLGSGSAITTSTMSLINRRIGIVLTSATALLTSIAILITKEYISNMKIRCNKLTDWINVITLLWEKTLKKALIDEKIDQKEAEQLKQIHIHYIDKSAELMKKTQFKVEDVFDDVISIDSISTEQITNLNSFSTKVM